MTSAPAPAVISGSARPYPRSFLISAWSVPVLVAGQFALLAIVPVLLILFRALRDPRLRDLRSSVITLGAAYATPLAIWAIRPNRARASPKT
jgi:hypothetical protein